MLTVDLILAQRLKADKDEEKRKAEEARARSLGSMNNLLSLVPEWATTGVVRQVKDEAGLVALNRAYTDFSQTYPDQPVSPDTFADFLTEYADPGHLEKTFQTAIDQGIIKDDPFGQATAKRYDGLTIAAAHLRERGNLRPDDYWRMASESERGTDRGALLDEITVLDPAPPQGWLPRFLSGEPQAFVPPLVLEAAAGLEEQAIAPLAGRGVMIGEALGFRPGEWEFQKPSPAKFAKAFTMTTEEAREFLQTQPMATQVLAEMAIPLLPGDFQRIGQAFRLAVPGGKITREGATRIIKEAVPSLRMGALVPEEAAQAAMPEVPRWGKLVQQFPETGQADAESLARTLQQRYRDRQFEVEFVAAHGDEPATWLVNDLTAGAKNLELIAREKQAAQAMGREGPEAAADARVAIPEAPAVKPLTPAEELARARVRPVAGAEMAVPEEAMTPPAPVTTADEVLDYWASAPKSEKAQRTVVREYSGRVNADLDSLDQTVRQMQEQANASGLKFAPGPTRDIPGVVLALDYEGPLDDALRLLQLSPEEEALARGLRGIMDQETALLRQAVPDFSFREYYWPHEFVRAPVRPTSRLFRGRPVGLKPGFTKTRKLEGTLADIIYEKPDLALYTGDPIAMAQRRIYQGILYRQQRVMIDNLKSRNLLRPASSLEDLAGWRTPKGVVGMGGKDRLVVPDEIAKALEDHFGISAFSSNVPLNVLRQSVAALKFVKTFGGLFQHFDYSMRVLATATKARDVSMVATIPKAFGRGFIPGLDAKMRRWDLANPVRQALIKHGINTQAGLQFIGPEYAAMAKEFFLYRIPFVGRMLKAFGSGTFVNAHREYMLDIGEKLVKSHMKGGMSLDDAAVKVALDMNERFSSLPAWQSVLRNPTTRDVVRTGLFSMAEQESWIRMPFRQKAFFGAILINTIALSNMVNLLVTGKPLPLSSYIPFAPKEGRIDPVTGKPRPPQEYLPFMGGGYNTAFLRPELPFKGPQGRTEYLDLLGQADTPLRMIGDPKFALASRLGQIPSVGGQIIAGEEAFGGETLQTPAQVGTFLAEQVSPIPAAGFWGEQQRIGIPGAIIQALGLNVSPQRLGELRNAVSRREFNGKEFRQLTPEEAQQFYLNHPELQAETDRVTKEGVERGEPWALYRTEYTDIYNDYNEVLAAVPATATGEEKRDALTNARIALSASLYRIEQDPRFAEIISQRKERDAGLLAGTIEPYNRAELLLAQRAQLYDTYRGPMGQVTDQHALNEALNAWEGGLSDADLKTLDDNTGLRLTVPWVKERREQMKQLQEYFDIPDTVYEANKEHLRLTAPSYSAYRTQATQEAQANAAAKGLGPEYVSDRDYPREYSRLQDLIEREKERYRRRNPDKTKLLIELGYKPPSKADIARERGGGGLPGLTPLTMPEGIGTEGLQPLTLPQVR